MRIDRVTLLSIVVCAVGLLVVSTVSVPAQGRSMFMTPWGDPDLQGTWNNITGTPLERPVELSEKEFYTEEEAVALAEQTLRRVDRDRRDGAIEADVGRAYNEFWSDRATKYLTQLNTRTSLIVDPKDGRLPSLTSGGETRIAARRAARERNHSWSDRNLWERCLTRGVPRLPGSYNNNFMIVQAPGYVVILVEMIHETRVIPLDGRAAISSGIRQWMGHSLGRWEDDTLIVETTHFRDEQEFRGTSRDLTLVERFTRINDDTIDYRATVDDVSSYERSWTVAVPMTRVNEDVFEYACHEGNVGMEGILAGARTNDAMVE
jgi:hypothetical protein